MPEASARDSTLPSVSRAVVSAPLADVACARNHPGREGLNPPVEPELDDGHVLDDRFVIREAIGRSGMATVYRAEDRSDSGRSVAIKMPLARVESDPVLYGRFQRELRIGTRLNHPYVLRFLPVERPRSRPYIAMEFLDGCTLAYILHVSGALPERDALRIASVACESVEYLHGLGIIHRDLKPANLMICRDCTFRLMDFGLAEEVRGRRGLLDSMTPLFGTPEYMAPEQVRNARNDERTDLYSLGAILYQMLTGVLPFRSDDPWSAAQMRVTGDPTAPRAVRPEITEASEELTLHAMRRRPDDRHQSVAAFRSELDAPERVHVTGLSGRLKAPRFRLSFQGTPLLSGVLVSVGILLALGVYFAWAIHHGGAGTGHSGR